MDVTGTVAFARGGHKRKLAHHQHLARHIAHTEIHHSRRIVKDAQVGDFLHQIVDVVLPIGGLDAQKDEQAVADLAVHFSINAHLGVCHTLDDDSHLFNSQ